jgi:hypothetical protein
VTGDVAVGGGGGLGRGVGSRVAILGRRRGWCIRF